MSNKSSVWVEGEHLVVEDEGGVARISVKLSPRLAGVMAATIAAEVDAEIEINHPRDPDTPLARISIAKPDGLKAPRVMIGIVLPHEFEDKRVFWGDAPVEEILSALQLRAAK